MQVVFGTFFVTLMVMLVFSSAIILYSSLFRAGDTALLLTLPARPERVFLNKFQEAILMSSWAFLLLGSPMLVAYGLVAEAPWYFFAMLLPFLVAFVYIPGGIGALVCLVVVHRLPKGRWYVLVGAGRGRGHCGALGPLVAGNRSGEQHPDAGLVPGHARPPADHRAPPAAELVAQRGTVPGGAAETGDDAVMFLALMISNALFFRQLAVWTAAAVYRIAYSRLCGHRGRRQVEQGRVDRPGCAPGNRFPVAPGPSADRQGPPAFPPRPGAMVPVADLHRAADLLLPQHPAVHLRQSSTAAGSTW